MSDLKFEEMDLVEPEPPMFGEDLRIDSEDEENLDNLPEIERELILEERFRILQKYKEEKTLYDRYVKKPEPVEPVKSVKPTKGAYQGRKSRQESYDSSSSATGSSSDDGSDSSYTSSDSEGEKEAAVLKQKRAIAATDAEIVSSILPVTVSLETSRQIQITRDMLLKSFQKVPTDLRDSALIDAFVRVPNGEGGYFIGQVVSVNELPKVSRTLESGRFELVVLIPATTSSVTAPIPVSSVSNSEITSTELDSWIERVGLDQAGSVGRNVRQKISSIKTVLEFVWDDSVINRMLDEKRRTNRAASVKLTLEIAKLRTSLQAELSALNNVSANDDQRRNIQEKITRIKSEISSLENQYKIAQRAFEEANAHQYGIVAINHRNRTQQRLQEMDEARRREAMKKTSSARNERAELNPFKRRECKPVVMWDVGKRSPKMEPQIEDPLKFVEVIDLELPSGAKTVSLSQLVDIERLVQDITSAINAGDRLSATQGSLARQYAKNPIASVWKAQIPNNHTGEIMTFEEWKRRVAEEDDVNMEQ
jgi:RNA polymerase-associated protein RTF1